MAFEAAILTLVGLIKVELPGHTVRLCDGAYVDFDSGAGVERYRSRDSLLGTIAPVDPLEEGLGDFAPGGELAFLPAPEADPATLRAGANQNARVRGWLGQLDADGKTVTSAEQLFDGLIDVPTLTLGAGGALALAMTFMSRAERLFTINRGNTCSARFHQSVWPGELGFDNCTDAVISVPWGAAAQPRGTSYGGSGSEYTGVGGSRLGLGDGSGMAFQS